MVSIFHCLVVTWWSLGTQCHHNMHHLSSAAWFTVTPLSHCHPTQTNSTGKLFFFYWCQCHVITFHSKTTQSNTDKFTLLCQKYFPLKGNRESLALWKLVRDINHFFAWQPATRPQAGDKSSVLLFGHVITACSIRVADKITALAGKKLSSVLIKNSG